MDKPIKIDLAAANKTDTSALVSLNPVVQAMHRRDWVYHQISVAADARGQGIGKKLLEAGADGIRIVALSSWNFNKGRHAFFKRLDYSAYRTDFWKAV